LRPQRHGPAGAKLPEAEHGSLSVQVGRGRGRRYLQERDDCMVRRATGDGRRAILTASCAALCVIGSCTSSGIPSANNRPSPVTRRPSERWADSILATLSPRDKAAQLVWPQLFGDYAPTSTAGWIRIQDLIQQQHVGGFIVSIGSPIETAVKLNAMQRLSAL